MVFLKALILIASGFGTAVSMVLVGQFYGATVSSIEGLCSRGIAGLDGCAIVSMSKYSSVSIPLLGELPVALFGSIFFGFICYLVIVSFFKKNDTRLQSEIFSLAISLTSMAFLINIILYIISKYVIKFICPLCVFTYICVIIMLPLMFFLLPFRGEGLKTTVVSIIKNSFYGVKNNIMKYSTAVLFIASLMLALSIFFLQPGVSSETSESTPSQITALIRHYENTGTTDIELPRGTMTGTTGAPVKVVIFHDFTCPFCIEAGKVFEAMNKKHPGLLQINYIPIPISGLCGDIGGEDSTFADACIAALGAACGVDQNRFRTMYEKLYENYTKRIRHTRESVRIIAENNKFDMGKFDTCFVSEEARNFVRKNYEQSEKADVQYIPTVFINKRRMPNTINNEDILQGFLEYLKRRE